jgi:hypothetical protein
MEESPKTQIMRELWISMSIEERGIFLDSIGAEQITETVWYVYPTAILEMEEVDES